MYCVGHNYIYDSFYFFRCFFHGMVPHYHKIICDFNEDCSAKKKRSSFTGWTHNYDRHNISAFVLVRREKRFAGRVKKVMWITVGRASCTVRPTGRPIERMTSHSHEQREFWEVVPTFNISRSLMRHSCIIIATFEHRSFRKSRDVVCQGFPSLKNKGWCRRR